MKSYVSDGYSHYTGSFSSRRDKNEALDLLKTEGLRDGLLNVQLRDPNKTLAKCLFLQQSLEVSQNLFISRFQTGFGQLIQALSQNNIIFFCSSRRNVKERKQLREQPKK